MRECFLWPQNVSEISSESSTISLRGLLWEDDKEVFLVFRNRFPHADDGILLGDQHHEIFANPSAVVRNAGLWF